METLRNRSRIMGQLQEVEERAPQKANKAELEYNHALFAILRAKRKELADIAGVPPYVIFSDRTLVELAAFTPQTPESILNINGIGQVKARQYGDIFLELIREYCARHGIKEREHSNLEEKTVGMGTKSKNNGSTPKHIVIGEAFNSGEPIQGLAERFSVSTATIINHLLKYSLDGNILSNTEELQSLVTSTPLMQKAVFEAFAEVGTEYLKPAFDRLNGTVNYDELKILRLLYIGSLSD